jgi:hypothetical protein
MGIGGEYLFRGAGDLRLKDPNRDELWARGKKDRFCCMHGGASHTAKPVITCLKSFIS